MGIFSRFFSRKTSDPKNIELVRRGISFNGGVPVNIETAMQVSAYNRGVIYISSQIAKLPWVVKDANNNTVDNNVSYLLDVAANPEMSAMDFRLMMIQNAINHGNGYAEIERDGAGRVISLWPLRSDRVTPMRTLAGNLVYRVTMWDGTTSQDTYLQPRDMYHLKNFHTKDGITGQGVMAYAVEILGISVGADKLANALFNNGGMPSGVISVTGTLSDEGFDKIKNGWKEAHSGRKSGGVAVLEEGATYAPVSFDPQILQFLESRKFNVVEISRFLGIPPTKLFDTQAATYSNTENANLEVVTDTLDAWAKQLEAQADIKLLNGRYGGNRSELDLYAVSRGDMTTRAKYFDTMMQMGAISSNEVRRKEGYAPYADGDRFYIAANNLSPADRMDEIIDAQIASKTAPTPAVKNNPTVDNPTKNLHPLEIKLLEKYTGEGNE
jgi:HK97 family phage portal protein